MSHSREDFRQFVGEKQGESARTNVRELRQLAQAEVPARAVTGSADWDFLLSLVQAKVEELNGVIASSSEAYAMDPFFEVAEMAQAKATLQRAIVQRDTLQSLVAFPKQIIDQGEKAQLVLRQYADE